MRWLPVAVLVLSGCVDIDPVAGPTEVRQDASTGLFEITDGGLRPWSSPHVQTSQDGNQTSYQIDLAALMQDNSAQLLLVEMQAPARLQSMLVAEVSYHHDGDAVTIEGDADGGACMGSWGYREPSPAFWIERATGGDAAYQPEKPGLFGRIHAASGGWINANGYHNSWHEEAGRNYRAGEWALFVNIASQIPASAVREEGNRWVLNLDIDAPHRIVRLPDAPFYCAAGFEELPGTTLHVSAPYEYHEGGRLRMQSIYGHQVSFCGDSFSAAGATGVNDAATLIADGKEYPVRKGDTFSDWTTNRTDFGVEVERWTTPPIWINGGLPAILVNNGRDGTVRGDAHLACSGGGPLETSLLAES